MQKNIITYEPDNSLRKGYFSLFGEIFREIGQNKWLTYQLFKRDFFAIYKQSFIGVFWAILIPLISVGTFILLNSSGVLSIGEIQFPYPVYAILGMAFWQLFATGLVASSNSIVKAGMMIVKINFSKKSLVLASAGQAIIPFVTQFLLVIILFFVYQAAPSLTILLFPLLLLPLLLFTLGLGFILALLNGVVRDIGNGLLFIITFLMFLTPVLYAKPTEGLLAVLTRYNPLYYLVSVPRELILQGTFTEWRGYLITSLVSLFLFVLCLLIFHLTETRVAERI